MADDGDTVTKYTYDVLNRLVGIDFDYQSGDDLTMVYDTDGNRVTRTEGATTVTYIGGLYEITKVGSTVTTRTHYLFGGDLIGTRVDDGTTDTITYTFGDHLGSVTAAYTPAQNGNSDGLQTQYYKPYGEPRGTAATLPSDHTYTGQIDDPGVLMYYNARYYQPSIGRFTQPDTIIPDPGNGQDWNRYMYVRGNPIMSSDPSGHVGTELVKDGARRIWQFGQDLPEEYVSGETPLGGVWRGVGNVIHHAAKATKEYVEYRIKTDWRRMTHPFQTAWDFATGTVAAEELTAMAAIASGGDVTSTGCRAPAICITGVDHLPAPNALAAGHTVVFRDQAISDSLMRHELQHVLDTEDRGGFAYAIEGIVDSIALVLKGDFSHDNMVHEKRANSAGKGAANDPMEPGLSGGVLRMIVDWIWP